MSWTSLRMPILLGTLMLVSVGLTFAVTPTKRMAEIGPKVDLARMIPEVFGEWQVDRSIVPIAVAPDVQAKLDKLYTQTLARTYARADGQRIMLSIAYGGDQSDAMRAHRPEVCYASQGFEVGNMAKGLMQIAEDRIPVMRLVARQRARIEPITYWMVVGDQVARTGLEQKFAQLKFGFAGVIPDGILIRVSSISANSSSAFDLHERFATDLLRSIDGAAKLRLVGKIG